MIPGIFAGGALGGSSPPISPYRSRLQFGGADGSTTFTDDTGKVWTANGSAQIDTSLGDQRGLFVAPGSYITTPDSADLKFNTGDFKISFGLRYSSLSGFQTIASRGYTINSNGAWLIQTGNGDGRPTFYVTNGGSTTAIVSDTTTVYATGTDYDIEVARVGSTATLSVNGAVVSSGPIGVGSIDASAELSIGGGSPSGYDNYWFDGWIKDFRIE